MNMINPVMDMCTDDRIILNRTQDTSSDLVKRIAYLEDIVLFDKPKKTPKSQNMTSINSSGTEVPEAVEAESKEESKTVFEEIQQKVDNALIELHESTSRVATVHKAHEMKIQHELFI